MSVKAAMSSAATVSCVREGLIVKGVTVSFFPTKMSKTIESLDRGQETQRFGLQDVNLSRFGSSHCRET